MQSNMTFAETLAKEFTENYLGKIFYFCMKRTSDNYEAEDLSQEIAFNILAALNKGVVPENFPAWVWQIARNRYSLWVDRKHKTVNAVIGSDIGDYEIEADIKTPLDELIGNEQLTLLRRELAFIKSEYRDILLSYYIENQSVRDIALSLSLSESAVKQRLHRARNILKEGMDMAREFGKRSYNPEAILYTNVCTRPGELGQPWTLMDPKLNQNIFLACYDNPMTAEELAIEVGVALPYIEDTVSYLTSQTLLIKNGNKYETNFPIISREAQQKIHFYYEGMIPQLISLITENIEILMAQYEEAGLCYYGEYQSYEEAKWMLLPNFYKGLYSLCKSSPKAKLGNTKRENNGIWDVVAFEKCDFTPDSVGFHCQSNGFIHYRFGYAGISKRTPSNLSEEETFELSLMVANKKPNNIAVAEKLVEYGYAYKKEDEYIPGVSVISKRICDEFIKFCKKKNHSELFIARTERQQEIHGMLMELYSNINRTVRDILYEDLPECIRKNTTVVDALLESICTTSHTLGYLVKHALASDWLKYDENTTPAVGAYLDI